MEHSLLAALEVDHAFGERQSQLDLAVLRPRQVHGNDVALVNSRSPNQQPDADAVVCSEPGMRIGVVTADCVPVLIALNSGRAVAAIHAGWRGLAAGVVEHGLAILSTQCQLDEELVAVIGPHIGPCCYEVDAPVIEALESRYGDRVSRATRSSRPDHWWLDLAELVTGVLLRAGLVQARIGQIPESCTACHADRFHSFRRDGKEAGRMLHYIAARAAS